MRDNAVPAGYRYFMFIAVAFVATLLISNIAAQKLIQLGPFTFTAGILLFPVSYIFGDCLTEVYGYAKTRQVIWAGFAANLVMAGFLSLVIALAPAPGWLLQESFAAVLAMVPRVVLASVVAYWFGEFANSFVLAKMKILTEGRYLWMRTIGSTFVGQAVDTAVFVFVAFAGVMPTDILVKVTWSGYLFKVLYEAVATPITYRIVGWLKRGEGIDMYDRGTDFTPFSLKT